MSPREAKERDQVRRALQVDFDLIREDERRAVQMAELGAIAAKLERIAELRRECGLDTPNSASFAG